MTPGVQASQTSDSDSDELERRLREVDALRRRVLNVIPHALRTPITTFRGLAEALPTASEDDIRTSITPALRRLAAQAERLLDDMLLAAGLTTTLPTSERVGTMVRPVVDDVWAEVGGGAPLVFEGDDDAAVLAPAGSLSKMLVHVLDNAAKYGDGTTTVKVVQPGDGSGSTAIVVDSPGAEITEIELLGQPFFRAEAAVMRSPGLGVGIAVARALAEHARGSLTVEARDGGGLITTIELEAV
ncbi:MAG TPA: HAMP domain-containing sensor histidine kinase [Acidimicrobiales bacterium]|nr:HAMP domain-containing sensor histidine kinase [Acidimicrobiales bacterium]